MTIERTLGIGFQGLTEEQQLQRAARELEGVVIAQLLGAMRKTVPEGGLFGRFHLFNDAANDVPVVRVAYGGYVIPQEQQELASAIEENNAGPLQAHGGPPLGRWAAAAALLVLATAAAGARLVAAHLAPRRAPAGAGGGSRRRTADAHSLP